VLDEDTADGLSIVYESGVFPDDFVEDVLGAIGEVSPEVADAGPLFLGTDRAAGEDPEGLQLVAPAAGTYTVVIAGYNHSEGDYEVSLEVEPADDAALDGDEIDYLDYLATYGEHVDFFCDEDFFGGDPEDVTSYGPTICDPDELAGVLSGEFNGDFTNDFGGGGDPYSDYSYDFSGDFSDDGDASAATTVSDDFADPPATSALGQPVPPSQFIDEFGTVPRFDRLARRCFAGNLALCDRLYSVTPVSPSTNSYEGYGATCGGRLAAEAPATCTTYG
jgi:hypothetical protein